jgi:hypothetical protein
VPHPDGIPHLVQKARLAGPAVNDLQQTHRRIYDERESICQVSHPAVSAMFAVVQSLQCAPPTHAFRRARCAL